MSMLLDTITGPVYQADGNADGPIRKARMGALAVTDVHAKYYEGSARILSFIGADLGGTPVTTQAGLSATTPALTLYNPVGSGKYGVLQTVTLNFAAAPAAASHLMLAVNSPTAAAPTATTNATIQAALTSSLAQPTLQCFRIATLAAAPVAIRYFGQITGAAALTPPQFIDHIDGEIIVGPGVALSVQTSTAASVVVSFTWEEVPI